MKFMNVGEVEFFDILSKLPSSIIFSRKRSPLALHAAQTVCTASSSLSFSKTLFSSSAILCQSQKRTSVPWYWSCNTGMYSKCLPFASMDVTLLHATQIRGQGCAWELLWRCPFDFYVFKLIFSVNPHFIAQFSQKLHVHNKDTEWFCMLVSTLLL